MRCFLFQKIYTFLRIIKEFNSKRGLVLRWGTLLTLLYVSLSTWNYTRISISFLKLEWCISFCIIKWLDLLPIASVEYFNDSLVQENDKESKDDSSSNKSARSIRLFDQIVESMDISLDSTNLVRIKILEHLTTLIVGDAVQHTV